MPVRKTQPKRQQLELRIVETQAAAQAKLGKAKQELDQAMAALKVVEERAERGLFNREESTQLFKRLEQKVLVWARARKRNHFAKYFGKRSQPLEAATEQQQAA